MSWYLALWFSKEIWNTKFFGKRQSPLITIILSLKGIADYVCSRLVDFGTNQLILQLKIGIILVFCS